ncbi:TOBE domain-containing protein [Pelagibacterium sp. H642]|nr:TOBE domain-containing protein [Pelagibacterium sp. H642]
MLRLPSGEALLASHLRGEVIVGIRPEDVRIGPAETSTSPIPARVAYREDLGSHEVLSARLGSGTTVNIATAPGEETALHSSEISLHFPQRHLHIFDAATGQSLSNTKKDS